MLHDARTLSEGDNLDSDVCIIGAGAAGITLAHELIGSGARVCLLESGGFEIDPEHQALNRGDNAGLPYHPLDRMRLRAFGGTTGHWAGWCRPPRPFAFPPRSWIPNSGWPFEYGELEPYVRRAHDLCQLGPYDYAPDFWADAPERRPLRFTGGRVKTSVIQFSPPTRFGSTYRADLERADNVHAWLHANVVRVDTDEAARTVTRLEAACLNGPRFSVTARHYILAAGGLENARLLLESDHIQRGGLGNGHDLVGRYFMDHIKFEAAQFQPARTDLPMAYYLSHDVRGIPIKGVLCFSEELLRREKMLECQFEFAPRPHQRPKMLDSSVGGVIVDASEQSEAPPRPWSVYLRLDPAPNPDSRVTLTDQRDALGMRRVRLYWRFGDLEKPSYDRATRLLATEVGRSGLGRMRITTYENQQWPPPPGGMAPTGFHHMGTTRMHHNPKKGVVDENSRVHGMNNLYVAGSSVFPNYEGYPTLTIVALALRLASHLRTLLS